MSKPRQTEETGFDKAIDWLLNSRFVDPGAVEIFWKISDSVLTHAERREWEVR